MVEADGREPGVERYLLRDQVLGTHRAVRFDAGHGERAFGCARLFLSRLFLSAWRGVPGAVAWARRVLEVQHTGPNASDVSGRFPLDELRALPLRPETWQVGLIPLLDEPNDDHAPLWLFGIANVDGRELRAASVIDQTPTEAVVWSRLIAAFLGPMYGDPSRPWTLVACRPEFCDAWKPWLSRIGVRCRYETDPQPVGQLLEAMRQAVADHALPLAGDVDIREFPQSDSV